jgi:hypothetical protein
MESRTLSADLEPIISSLAIAKSGRVLKAFSLLYLPFHGLGPCDLFRFYGPIAFVSAAVYQADELNENEGGGAASLSLLWDFLQRRGFLDEQISGHLRDGEAYLNYERHCREANPHNLQELVTAMAWRSSDFRILHCLLYKFLGKSYEQEVFDVYAAFEMMMELDDDIGSYEDDAKAGTFNFMRALTTLRHDESTGGIEEFRDKVISRIEACGKLLSLEAAQRFQVTLNTYAELVPQAKIPIICTH